MFIIVNHCELILTRSKTRDGHMIQRLVLEWYRVWSLSRSRWVSKYLYPAKMPQIRIINGSYLDTIHIADGYFYLENSSILLIQAIYTENISVSHYRRLSYIAKYGTLKLQKRWIGEFSREKHKTAVIKVPSVKG